ncbi:UvrD-helicase domain-containing protein [Candidatus Parcubacteria bacterium]|nr:UvrD-helicase domain-containing protein [Candidatus Parcubacteria bacterium]
MSEFIKQLNKEQEIVATHNEGPLLVVAGAGTGKTTVLIERLNFLIKNKLAGPDEILITTFTEKAAGEMEERADKILPYGYVDLWINTFHGFCERILRDHALDIGLPGDFKLLSQTEQWMMIRDNLNEFDLEYYKPLGNPTKFVHELLKHFSRLKDENISSVDYLDCVKKHCHSECRKAESKNPVVDVTMLDSRDPRLNLDGQASADAQDDNVSEGELIEQKRLNELAGAYKKYNELLLKNSFLDFGDLIVYTIKLFKERPNILKFYQNKFKYIMVDEFQDTNYSQYELIKLLAMPKNNLIVVGDDDQCLPGESKILLRDDKEKRIDKIKKGDEVVTAVGKGYLSHSHVVNNSKITKETKLITFKTKKGFSVSLTDNHKMFCFIPENKFKKGFVNYFYVYLMYKQGLGWRMGVTNDLKIRLRLERTADKLVAIKACKTEVEARYAENLLSLKYGIPTNVFAERDGIMTRKKLVEQLYKDLDVQSGVNKLADDFGMDLEAHQISSNAVNRSGKVRIKINLEMCNRNYKTKGAKKFLKYPQILHLLSVETTHKPTTIKLKELGYSLTKARKGMRFRVSSSNLQELGRQAKEIQKATGGIIENSIKVGVLNIQCRKALIVPASNVLEGMFLPVVTSKGVIHDQIILRTEKEKKIIVYDLEIEKTHNFIVNGVVVHNSIYAFRGSSMHNIMQFSEDYPETKKVVLNKNYRSGQEILDVSYDFIQKNNPNRLEVKLGIDKKLDSPINKKGTVTHLHYKTEAEETEAVVQKIGDICSNDENLKWSDFAILVRANNTAIKFVNELDRRGIPNQFVSLRGLYYKPIIVDAISYFKLLDNYHESSALFRVLNMDIFKVDHADIVNINKFARRKVWSTFEALKNIDLISSVSDETKARVKKLLELIEKHSVLVKQSVPSKIFLSFMKESGLLKNLDQDKDREIFDYLNQFYKKIKDFESNNVDLRLNDFMRVFEMELESGETGALKNSYDDIDVVKVMTVHAAKGLEFEYVFMPSVVDKKFPVIKRKEKITIPEELVKVKIQDGDFHIEEERRLFYVAITRTKKELFITTASDYGGAREKKISKFLEEMGVENQNNTVIASAAQQSHDGSTNNGIATHSPAGEAAMTGAIHNELIKELNCDNKVKKSTEVKYVLPKMYSFSQLEAYSNCPQQYKYSFILKIPAEDKVNFIFGRVMHNTMKDFFDMTIDGDVFQRSLFSNKQNNAVIASATRQSHDSSTNNGIATHSPAGEAAMTGIADDGSKPSRKDLLDIYKRRWVDNGYEDKKQRQEYLEKGKKILTEFYEKLEKATWPNVVFTEKGFNVKIGGYTLRGSIDRIDKLPDGTVEIVDYKTGNPKEKLDVKNKRQLILYKIAVEQTLGLKVSTLSFYYLENNSIISFEAKDAEVEKLEIQIIEQIEEIKKCNFTAKPGFLCDYCDFKGICEFKK